jgi:uncharacterized protein (UPF0332 family)
MRLTESERNSIVQYRLEKAKNTLAEIEVLIKNHLWNIAANRLYYACFYAVNALLINDGYDAHTHGGVKSLLGLHYVKTGKIDTVLKDLYLELFNLRQTGDYDDMVTITESDINPLFEPVKDFIETVEKLILSNQATG